MSELKPVGEIRRELRGRLPAEAFQAEPRQLITLFAHLAIIVGCVYALNWLQGPLWAIFLGVIMGSSIFCIGNLCHYLGHGSIVQNRRLRYAAEYFFFAITLTPATVFKVVHNQYHHAYTNGRNDTFRCFAEDERTFLRTVIRLLFFPNKHLPWNPLVLVSYNLVVFSQIGFAMFGRSGRISSVIPLVPTYTRKQRLAIWLEVLGSVAFILALSLLVGQDTGFVLALLVAYSIATAISCFYIYIQHDTIELSEENHPLKNSMNLQSGQFLNWLHSNVSYHIEHHLFPGMNFKYAETLSQLLKEKYPEHYRVASGRKVWADLFRNDIYKTPPTTP